MSTKVKGEAIKEGSIPLSALSSEVQEKIENSGSKVFVFTYDMVKSENEDGSLTIDPANAIEMINSDFINMMDAYNMEKTHTYDDFATFSLTLKLSPLMSQIIVMYVYSEGVIVIMSAEEEHPFVYDSDSGENENKVRKRLSLLDLALGDSDRKDYTEYIDEVKENVKKNLGISDPSTPDWNAAKGEAGYIENKPFFENVLSYRLDDVDKIDRGGYFSDDNQAFGLIYDSVITVFKDEYLFDNTIDSFGAYETTLSSRAEELGCVVIEREDGRYELVIPKYYAEGLPGWRVVYSEDVYNAPLPSRFLPDTVLKTTPQTLSNDDKIQVKENLGISTPNWNAQEGEVGYIENKPFYAEGDIRQIDVNGDYSILIGEFNIGDRIDVSWDLTYYDGEIFRGSTSFVTQEQPTTYYEKDNFYINGGKTFEMYAYGMCDSLYGKVTVVVNGEIKIKTLEEIYLPNTILKTTPQTLSDVDKNQALANLGIDPVVWKYMCNPHIVEFDRTNFEFNNAIPKELSDIIYQNGKFNHLVLSTVLVKIFNAYEESDAWKVERITAYNEKGNVHFNEEEFGYDSRTRLFVI